MEGNELISAIVKEYSAALQTRFKFPVSQEAMGLLERVLADKLDIPINQEREELVNIDELSALAEEMGSNKYLWIRLYHGVSYAMDDKEFTSRDLLGLYKSGSIIKLRGLWLKSEKLTEKYLRRKGLLTD